MKKIEDLKFGRACVYYSSELDKICISTWFKDFVIDEIYDCDRNITIEDVYASPNLKWNRKVILLGEL